MESVLLMLDRNRNQKVLLGSGFMQLFISKRLLHGAATALVGIFVPIFIYETTGQQFYIVGLYYALLSLLYAVLLVPGMWITNRVGFSRTLVLGGACSVLLYAIMYFMDAANFWYLLAPLTVAIVAFRIFHWVPFHVDFTLFTTNGERGRLVGLSMATIAFMGVVGPILAGFIIANANYSVLFAVAVALLIAATISYAFVPETLTHFDWTYKETLRRMWSPSMRGMVVGEYANGAEVIVSLIVWPIFLYEILDGDVFEIGAISTLIVAVTIIVQLALGKYLDQGKDKKEKTLRVGSTLYAVGWILRIFVISTAQIFFVGLYHNIMRIFTKTPFSAILYDLSADQGKYVDEYTVVREMAGHLGRFSALVVISGLSLLVPLGWTFVIAAVASLALNMVYRVAQS